MENINFHAKIFFTMETLLLILFRKIRLLFVVAVFCNWKLFYIFYLFADSQRELQCTYNNKLFKHKTNSNLSRNTSNTNTKSNWCTYIISNRRSVTKSSTSKKTCSISRPRFKPITEKWNRTSRTMDDRS